MTQIIRNGPDIPPHLLHAHERGEVVFFCGAGISFPQGLPGFEGLVRGLYNKLGIEVKGAAHECFVTKHFDFAVGQLEKAVAGGRLTVLKEISECLHTSESALSDTHSALLDLSRCPNTGKVRLVTTNFDRLFESMPRYNSVKRYTAPWLPTSPKDWDGIVYLHGLLPPVDSDDYAENLDRLIISGEDFGRAYMTQQWATRFVGSLLSNYTVCFVGYSVDDPAIRYLTTAHAADNGASDGSGHKAYAFVESVAGEEQLRYEEWGERGVIPILYDNRDNHALLHQTMHKWAAVHRNGKSVIVDEHAYAPLHKHVDRFVVQQMLWAIADTATAKHFADLPRTPPFDWLDIFADNANFDLETLPRFGVDASFFANNNNFSYNLFARPTNSKLAPQMRLAFYDHREGEWDGVMWHLARWLLRYKNNPGLIFWLARHGGRLHDEFSRMVQSCLQDDGAQGIPHPVMRAIWRLLLSGCLVGEADDMALYQWEQQLRRDGISVSLRLWLREILSPRIVIGGVLWNGDLGVDATPQKISDILHCRIKPRVKDARYWLAGCGKKPHWQAALPLLLDDFTGLLHDTLSLAREIGKADSRQDESWQILPSISDHEQNEYASEWGILVECARDAWLETKKTNVTKALRKARDWQKIPYPIFKRLAFFAAAQEDVVPARVALKWLLSDNGWWLWAEETQRESIRLIVALAPKLGREEARLLASVILKGMPRKMQGRISDEGFNRINDRAVWLRLAKARDAGMVLNQVAQSELDALSEKHPWNLAEDERDEFPFWMESGWVDRSPSPGVYESIPKNDIELAEWIKKPPVSDGLYDDSEAWQKYCHNNRETVLAAFAILAKCKNWPAERWGGALRMWGNDESLGKSWQAATLIIDAEDEFLKNPHVVHPLASWLRKQWRQIPEQDGALFFRLSRRVIMSGDKHQLLNVDPLTDAMNNPVGMATEGLLHWLFRSGRPQLNADMRNVLTLLCEDGDVQFRPARVWIAAFTRNLFIIDEEWTKQTLLPLFDWNKSAEAHAVWYGFLFFYRATFPLIEEIKAPFLDTAMHCGDMGEMGHKYAAVLTWLALGHGNEIFSQEQFREATDYLSEVGLCRAADAIIRALKDAGEQRGECWRGRVSPYFKHVWPRHKKKVTQRTAEQIARVCIAAEDNFADAMNQLEDFLVPVGHPGGIYHGYLSSELCTKFPEEALRLIAAITGDGPTHARGKLREYLDTIRQARPELADTPEFIRLKKLCE